MSLIPSMRTSVERPNARPPSPAISHAALRSRTCAAAASLAAARCRRGGRLAAAAGGRGGRALDRCGGSQRGRSGQRGGIGRRCAWCHGCARCAGAPGAMGAPGAAGAVAAPLLPAVGSPVLRMRCAGCARLRGLGRGCARCRGAAGCGAGFAAAAPPRAAARRGGVIRSASVTRQNPPNSRICASGSLNADRLVYSSGRLSASMSAPSGAQRGPHSRPTRPPKVRTAHAPNTGAI